MRSIGGGLEGKGGGCWWVGFWVGVGGKGVGLCPML